MMRASLLHEFRGDEAEAAWTATVANGGAVTARGGASLLGSLTDASLRMATTGTKGSLAYISRTLPLGTAFSVSFYICPLFNFTGSNTNVISLVSGVGSDTTLGVRLYNLNGVWWYDVRVGANTSIAAKVTAGQVQHLDWTVDLAGAGSSVLTVRGADGSLQGSWTRAGTGSAPTSLRIGAISAADAADRSVTLDVAGVAAYSAAIARGPLRVRRHVRSLAVAGSALNWPNAHGRPELAGAL